MKNINQDTMAGVIIALIISVAIAGFAYDELCVKKNGRIHENT
jgi:hypothetical protein